MCLQLFQNLKKKDHSCNSYQSEFPDIVLDIHNAKNSDLQLSEKFLKGSKIYPFINLGQRKSDIHIIKTMSNFL